MSWREEWVKREPLLARTAMAHVGLLAVCVLLALVDGTEVGGVNRWIKPMKFTASVAIYLGSLAWYWPVALAGETAKRRAAWVLAGTMIFEIVIILVQAGRGVRSHFNDDTAMDLAVFNAMGVAIMVNIAAAAVVGRWTWRSAPTAYVWGVRLGLVVFVVFALEGMVMARRMGHAVGVAEGGVGLPLLNWSREGGDLRVAHFVGMHALQGLPLIGSATRSNLAVATASAVWVWLAIAALWRALEGKPLVAM